MRVFRSELHEAKYSGEAPPRGSNDTVFVRVATHAGNTGIRAQRRMLYALSSLWNKASMLLRAILITSLISQLALSFRCCGVVIIRPDVVMTDCDSSCMSTGVCVARESQGSNADGGCCSPAATSCCEGNGGDTSADCCAGDPGDQPCQDNPGRCSSPVDPKKQGPDVDVMMHLPAPLAYMLPPPAPMAVAMAVSKEVPAPVPWTSHQDRQARLSVWRN
jgi:hypothetical protein